MHYEWIDQGQHWSEEWIHQEKLALGAHIPGHLSVHVGTVLVAELPTLSALDQLLVPLGVSLLMVTEALDFILLPVCWAVKIAGCVGLLFQLKHVERDIEDVEALFLKVVESANLSQFDVIVGDLLGFLHGLRLSHLLL